MALNPVERRLVDLRDHWENFRADVSKRLLIWQVPDNAVRMLQCFFEAQKHEAAYTTGDLFIAFDTPFEHSIQYSRALKEVLAGRYEASRQELEQEGITPDWRLTPGYFPDSTRGFVASLSSFGSKHHKFIGHLVAVLMPSDIASGDGFVSWLSRALDAGIPERLRFAVIDSIETPRLQALADARSELVYVDAPNIDAMVIAQETFAQEGALGPAAVFRNFLMGLITLIEKGSADQVKRKAADALAFARREQWADQEVVVAILMAGALLKEKRFDEAIRSYQDARHSALQAAASGHPAGRQLVLQTLFGEAGTHLAAGDVAQAAECYDTAAAVAQEIRSPILAIEAFRMAAFCNARMDQLDAALERGSDAVRLGAGLKPAARAMTTLPIAAVDLLRFVDADRVTRMENVKHRLDARIEKARATLEQRAAELEQVSEPHQLRAAEDDLARETAGARKEAAQQLEAVAGSGSKQFREIYANVRRLLGDTWLLQIPGAMPGAPASAQTPSAMGVAAA